ncbi:MAG TPA: SRPBCC family protein [Saprospiraceae bacterium]|jgi:uncharacterized protein YndB with AHSA1/START domain|nr:SRPBCC family protein [Saprospiraceae bacterium]HRP85111.1 SRPBCC family protein [Saprospiraceae bacterium]
MITIKALIKADAQKVWDYYTLPHHIIRWNFADPGWHCPKAENDLRPGGTYKARMEAKDGSFGFDFEAIYTDVQPGKEFSYEFGGRKASVSFSKNGEETEIVICFDPETTHSIELQRSGWQSILNNFKSYTENN